MYSTKMTAQIQDFVPERISSWDQRLMRLVGTRHIRVPVDLGYGRGQLTLAFSPESPQPGGQEADLIMAWEGNHMGVVFHEAGGLHTLMGIHEKESPFFGIDPAILPEEVYMALVEALFKPVSTFLSSTLGKKVEWIDPEEGPEFFNSPALETPEFSQLFSLVNFRFDAGGDNRVTGCLYLPCESSFFAAMESVLADFDPKQLSYAVTEDLLVEAVLGIGEITLALNEIKTLEKGDILIPDAWFFSQNQGMLNVQPFSFRFAFEEDHIVLLEKGVMRVDDVTKEEMDDIEDLEIKVTFEVERRMMPVKEIRTLVKDTVIPIGTTPEQGVVVDIVAGGKILGKGKIVSLGETLGIRIIDTRSA